MRSFLRFAFAALLLLPVVPSFASGGSYLVDDASTATPGRCQLESWIQAFRGGTRTAWTVPACGIGPVEVGLGLAGQTHPGRHFENPSVKWQLRNGDEEGVGVALATDTTFENGHRESTNVYAASNVALDRGRRLMANVNVGMTWSGQGGWHRLAGLGVEYAVTHHVGLLAERLWTTGLSQATQAGIRFYFGTDDSVDLVVGREHERSLPSSRWATVGLNLAF